MNVSTAMINIPKDIKTLKSKSFFISQLVGFAHTPFYVRIEVNHPVSRLPVAFLLRYIL